MSTLLEAPWSRHHRPRASTRVATPRAARRREQATGFKGHDSLRGEITGLEPLKKDVYSVNRVLHGNIGTQRVIVKPLAGMSHKQMRLTIKPGNGPARDLGAFRVAQHMGIHAPKVAVRDVPGHGPALVVEAVGSHNAKLKDWTADEKAARLRKMALFDAVIGNTDRHKDNIRDEDWAIDHDLAWPDHNGKEGASAVAIAAQRSRPLDSDERDLLHQVRGHAGLHRGLREDGLSSEAVRRMDKRIDLMLARGRYPAANGAFKVSDLIGAR